MNNQTILTREVFELLLGGGFESVANESGRRDNKKFSTYTDGTDCFCRAEGKLDAKGATWGIVASLMERAGDLVLEGPAAQQDFGEISRAAEGKFDTQTPTSEPAEGPLPFTEFPYMTKEDEHGCSHTETDNGGWQNEEGQHETKALQVAGVENKPIESVAFSLPSVNSETRIVGNAQKAQGNQGKGKVVRKG